MPSLEDILQQVRSELDAEFRERVRSLLTAQPTDWLVEQLLAHVMAARPPAPVRETVREAAAREAAREPEQERAERLDRIRQFQLDRERLAGFVHHYEGLTRERLEAGGLLLAPPPKGSALVGPEHRSPAAAALLQEAKDLLYALLFATGEEGVRLDRVERELLTITLPRAKAHAIAFAMQAATEIGTEGTWRDPHRMADDDRAPNVLLQVEYGEIAEELVGNGIASALRLINNLEVNEQVLYARMENVEESALGVAGVM
jgi:hypothetical protein